MKELREILPFIAQPLIIMLCIIAIPIMLMSLSKKTTKGKMTPEHYSIAKTILFMFLVAFVAILPPSVFMSRGEIAMYKFDKEIEKTKAIQEEILQHANDLGGFMDSGNISFEEYVNKEIEQLRFKDYIVEIEYSHPQNIRLEKGTRIFIDFSIQTDKNSSVLGIASDRIMD